MCRVARWRGGKLHEERSRLQYGVCQWVFVSANFIADQGPISNAESSGRNRSFVGLNPPRVKALEQSPEGK